MTEKKRKRYPADRQKLHALLEKREQELIELQEEVEELRRLVQQADRTAIHATAELYQCYPGTACGDHAVHVRGRSAFRAVPE